MLLASSPGPSPPRRACAIYSVIFSVKSFVHLSCPYAEDYRNRLQRQFDLRSTTRVLRGSITSSKLTLKQKGNKSKRPVRSQNTYWYLSLYTTCSGSVQTIVVDSHFNFTQHSSLVPRPLPPEERPGTHCLHMRVISPVFRGFVK